LVGAHRLDFDGVFVGHYCVALVRPDGLDLD